MILKTNTRKRRVNLSASRAGPLLRLSHAHLARTHHGMIMTSALGISFGLGYVSRY